MANLHVQHHIICIHLHYHVLTLGSVLSGSLSGAAEVVNGKSRLAICTTRLGSRRVAATAGLLQCTCLAAQSKQKGGSVQVTEAQELIWFLWLRKINLRKWGGS